MRFPVLSAKLSSLRSAGFLCFLLAACALGFVFDSAAAGSPPPSADPLSSPEAASPPAVSYEYVRVCEGGVCRMVLVPVSTPAVAAPAAPVAAAASPCPQQYQTYRPSYQAAPVFVHRHPLRTLVRHFLCR